MEATKPYEFIGFGAMDATKPSQDCKGWRSHRQHKKVCLRQAGPYCQKSAFTTLLEPSSQRTPGMCRRRWDRGFSTDAGIPRHGAYMAPNPNEFIGFGPMEVTKPYEFMSFGAMEITDLHGPREEKAAKTWKAPWGTLGSGAALPDARESPNPIDV